MANKEYKNIYHLTKGFGDWVKAGYETENKNKK
jgi:rhodanese-related sulfurtransferase